MVAGQRIGIVLCGWMLFTGQVSADLMVNLSPDGLGGTLISLAGMGTVTAGGSNPGGTLNFDNFEGTPFIGLDGSGSGITYTLSTTLSLVNMDDIDSIRIDNDGLDASDFDLFASPTISNGDVYSASGSATIVGLSYNNLVPGNYAAPLASDVDNFGSVTLNVAPVPEPGSALFLSVAAAMLLGATQCKRIVSKLRRGGS